VKDHKWYIPSACSVESFPKEISFEEIVDASIAIFPIDFFIFKWIGKPLTNVTSSS